MQIGIGINEHRLTRIHVSDDFVATVFNHQRFAGHNPLITPLFRCTASKNERANAIGIPKRQHSMASDQGNGCIGALNTLMQGCDRIKQLIGGQITAGDLGLNLCREHIDQHLRITGGVGVASIHLEQILLQLMGVGQIAVMNKADAIGGVHIKGLHLLFSRRGPPCGVAHMADAGITEQLAHIARPEGFPNTPPLLVHMEGVSVHRDDAR